ncbi:MAG: hypothetical protein HYS13_25905 [Planctomycetia bacterium]|nr:hypothetical protein [Planctomycetia bacterium]
MATPSSHENSGPASPISFKLPEGAKVRGAVYRTKHPDYLTEDLMEVELPGNVFIAVGWHPSWDPKGSFVITVFRGDWDDQLENEQLTKDIDDLIAKVEATAARYTNGAPLAAGKPAVPPLEIKPDAGDRTRT